MRLAEAAVTQGRAGGRALASAPRLALPRLAGPARLGLFGIPAALSYH